MVLRPSILTEADLSKMSARKWKMLGKVCVSTWLDGKRWKQGRDLWKGELSN